MGKRFIIIPKIPRRDRCYLVGRRGKTLDESDMANAWGLLCQSLVELGERDMPKFDDLLKAIRTATVRGRYVKHNPEWDEATTMGVIGAPIEIGTAPK